MSSYTPSGLKESTVLTGQIMVDKNQEEFRGNYSCVHKGIYQNQLVAAKVIQRSGNPESMKRKLKRECMVWATTNHPNILPFYGLADDAAFAPYGAFISPWCTKGDASRYLGEHGETMPFNDRIELWKGVINGVAYLHEHEPIIIHGDLKPGNILIDESGRPRICDFGLARIFLEEGHTDLTTTSEHTGTARYLAPELVSSDEPVLPTTSSDVYALACIGLEFIYGQKPYANRANNLRGQIYIDIRRGLPPAGRRPSYGWPSCRAWPLLTEMWSTSPLHRPLAFTISYTLDRILFTLPHTVVQIIVYFAATILGPGGEEVKKQEWVERCHLLQSLCLVSKGCKDYTLPFLYGKIRLHLRGRYIPLVCLVETLACTEGRVDTRNPIFTLNGLVKTIILVIEPGDNVYLGHKFPIDLWPLVEMIPGLRCMVLSRYDLLFYPIPIHPLSTLEIRGLSSSLLVQKSILRALLLMQHLSITYGSWAPGLLDRTPVASYSFFPNLRAISIMDDSGSQDSVDTLDAMSRWKMPRLTSLHFECAQSLVEANSKILVVLEAHGHTIQALTFAAHISNNVLFSRVLSLCPNLRSLVISTPQFALPNDFLPHLNLERIVIWPVVVKFYPSTAHAYQATEFKRLFSTLLPKLDTAEFRWCRWRGRERTIEISASFKVGVDGIRLNRRHPLPLVTA